MDSSTFMDRVNPECIINNDYIMLIISKLRQAIYEFLLHRKFSNEEDDADDEYNEEFDLTRYLKLIGQEHIAVVTKELECAGWSTLLAYGNTCLFIYLGDRPARCRE